MEWIFGTVLPIYRLIEQRRKTYDTRAPNPSNPQKRYNEIKEGDIILIMPVSSSTFEPLDLPTLRYEVSDVKYSKPQESENWESVVKRMFDSVDLEKVFPGYSLEQALKTYQSFPNYPQRITKHGIVAIGLGKRLE